MTERENKHRLAHPGRQGRIHQELLQAWPSFEALVADLENEYQPATDSEALLVHDLAKFYWLKQRAIRLQQAAILDAGPVRLYCK